jgi:TRAP-type C4-dicarboxylate transport system permease small subunit
VKILELLAKACAVLAGVLLIGITLMTCISLIGRNTTGWSIVGAFEMSGYAAGAAIALFMPWCQYRRGNIIVDFFTAHLAQPKQDVLDRFGALMLAAAMGLMAWRTTIGGINAWKSQAGSMIMGVPEWTVYVCMAPALTLTAVIALVQAVRGFPTHEAQMVEGRA